MNTRYTVGLFLLALAGSAPAQLLKCVSKDGRVEYASVCPPGTTQERRLAAPRPAPAGPAAKNAKGTGQKTLAEREAEFRKRQIEQQEASTKQQKEAQEAQERKRNCENAAAYLKSLETGQRIARTDPKTGERVFLEDSERQSAIADARRAADNWCK
ncbi:MAG: DUF4124 domain-containing protein [Betaproteobacteria bacterium]|nr:DUF4124 domain-containing protein [Betaproteobacteria bacterium]